jgi:hypothetical protein
MSPNRQFTTVAAAQVLNCPKRYSEYHAELVNLLVKVVATQSDGLSDGKRRAEVLAIVEAFGNLVTTKIKE